MISRILAIKCLRRLADNLEDPKNVLRMDDRDLGVLSRIQHANKVKHIQAQIREDTQVIEKLLDEIKPRRTSLKDILDIVNQE